MVNSVNFFFKWNTVSVYRNYQNLIIVVSNHLPRGLGLPHELLSEEAESVMKIKEGLSFVNFAIAV